MQKFLIADSSFGVWEKGGLDAKQPQASLSIANSVYVDDDGVLRLRGRMGRRNAGDLGSGAGYSPVFVWAGALLPGFREVFVAYDATPSYRFTVLDNAGTGYAIQNNFGSASATPDIIAAAVAGNALIMSPNKPGGFQWVYGGSRMPAGGAFLSTTFTPGSTTLTTTGSYTTAGVDVGAIVSNWYPSGGGFAVVTKVNSATTLTVDRPAQLTGVVAATFYSPFVSSILGPSFALSGQIEAIAGRAVLMQGNILVFSDGPDPTTGAHRTYSWPAKNRHEFPNDALGVALKALRDRLFVFTQAGNYAISGMAYEITDGSANPQHAIEQISGKSVALGQSGIVSWQGALIVPCRDGVFAMDGVNSPVLLSRGLPWAEMVRGGLKIGWATIFQGRYLLPVTYQGSTWTYVFRMDGIDSGNGIVFPTTRFVVPASPTAWATSSSDKLIAMGDPAQGALEGGELLTTTSTGVDFDGNPAGDSYQVCTPRLQIGQKAVLRRIRIRYSMYSPTLAGGGHSLLIDISDSIAGHTASGSVQLRPTVAFTPQWVAVDIPAYEVTAPVIVLSFLPGSFSPVPGNFVVHAIELQYRVFGGP